MRASRAEGSYSHDQPGWDAVTFLTVYLIAVFGIESRLVVGPLGGAGSPAQLIGMLGMGWWMYYQVQRSDPVGAGPHPVRRALLVLLLAVTASYVAAMSRPIAVAEASTANLGLVALLGFSGVALLAHDGIPSLHRLDQMVQRLVVAAAALATLGIAQFVFKDPLIRWFSIPGLTPNLPLSGLEDRSGFARAFGTALHPIEFGAVLTMVLPIAVSRARTDARHGRLRSWLPVALMAFGVVVANSRSAILSSVVGLAALAFVWSVRTRLFTLGMVVVFLAFVSLTVPGLLGSLLRLFSGASADGSVQSRTGSYAIVGQFFEKSPLVGRGYSTFQPGYRILDNEYLLLLVEIGLIGLLAMIGLLFAAGRCAVLARRAAVGVAEAEQAQAFLAAICAAAAGLATYDGLNFPMATGILFLVLGLAGAQWRLARRPREATADATDRRSTQDAAEQSSYRRPREGAR